MAPGSINDRFEKRMNVKWDKDNIGMNQTRKTRGKNERSVSGLVTLEKENENMTPRRHLLRVIDRYDGHEY